MGQVSLLTMATGSGVDPRDADPSARRAAAVRVVSATRPASIGSAPLPGAFGSCRGAIGPRAAGAGLGHCVG